jgi:hypothetical protein
MNLSISWRLGFLVIQPQCQGQCEIALAWTGRGDLPVAAVVSIATLGLLAAMAVGLRAATSPSEPRP